MKIILIGLMLSCIAAQEISKDAMIRLLSSENEMGTEQYSFKWVQLTF